MNDDQKIKEELAIAYRIIAILGLDDLTYTHITSRPPGKDYFYIYAFGLLFEEVTSRNLLKVDFDGNILEGEEYQYNLTGFITHGSIYKARKDVNAIFHLHTPDTVAVSAMKCGLLPLSQWALHFYQRIKYHDYNSLLLSGDTHAKHLVDDLAESKIMLMRNHGLLTNGSTIQEALFFVYHLELACKTQCKILSSNRRFVMPSSVIAEKSARDLLSFESGLGQRDWKAWVRLLERKGIHKEI